jgi:5-formyltetrahydrofolate cyclo-ligase
MDGAPLKNLLRDRARRARLAMDGGARKAASDEICRRLAERVGASSPRPGPCVIAAYLASPLEVDLSGFISVAINAGDTVCVPRWTGETYRLARLMSLDSSDLERGPMGILQPKSAPDGADGVDPASVDVWIVPGLAFDAFGGRIGYGGGWYDRLLASARSDAEKIGVVFHVNYLGVEALPVEEHDVRMTGVVTEGEEGF